MRIFHKIIIYLHECLFCLKAGVKPKDKINLVGKTIAFHFDKRNHRIPRLINANVRIGSMHANLKMRDSGGDMFIFHEVLNQGVYQVKPEWLKRKPETIIDLGANIGLTSLYLASQFSDAKIISVEPHPETVSLLRHNLACLGPRAQILEAAVSDQSGAAVLHLADEAYNASLTRQTEKSVQVQSVTMDEILEKHNLTHIDILKVDIEGAEKKLFSNFPSWLKKVDFLMIEMHPGYGFPELERDLSKSGLKVYRQGVAQGMAKREISGLR